MVDGELSIELAIVNDSNSGMLRLVGVLVITS